ncbi:MAG: hypothetical protein ACI8S6_000743 [Myxococcota bacterium]|jgi:hypothetical protein
MIGLCIFWRKFLIDGLTIREAPSVFSRRKQGVALPGGRVAMEVVVGMLQETAEMVASGIGLVAREVQTWSDGETLTSLRPTLIRRVVSTRGEVAYEVVDYRSSLEGELHRFDEPVAAARLLLHLVGRCALSQAIASHRYAYLFPRGSSLDWSPGRTLPRHVRARSAA